MMLEIKLTAMEHSDLTPVCNEILDGSLGYQEADLDLTPTTVPSKRPFAGGNDRTIVIEIALKKPVTDRERARIQAELSERYGDIAQIHIREK